MAGGGIKHIYLRPRNVLFSLFMMLGLLATQAPILVSAISSSGSNDITALVLPTPPNDQAIINQPKDGAHLSTTPLVIHGTCGPALLVRVYDNGTIAGTATCSGTGNFTMNINLSLGKNVLKAMNFDQFQQAGPNSATVTVYVDEPANIDIGSVPNTTQNPATTNPGQDQRQIFSNTPLGLVSRLFNVRQPLVSAQSHAIIASAINVSFVLILLIAIAIIFL